MVKKKIFPNLERIYIAGFVGSSKSSVGRILAEHLDRPFIDLDDVIVREAGMPVSEIFHFMCEPAFRKMESRVASKFTSGPWVVALGSGALVNPRTRDLLIASGTVVYLRAKPETLADRFREQTGKRPLLAGEGALEEKINSLLARRRKVYNAAHWIVDTDELTPEQVADRLYERTRTNTDE
jgi:shikimate kinase